MTVPPPLKILIVGAGSVGQIFGYHLSKGGADVHFLVRDYQAPLLRSIPMRVHRLCAPGEKRIPTKTALLSIPEKNIYTIDDVEAGQLPLDFNCILIAVSSAALRGRWIRDLLQVIHSNPKCILYCFSPGVSDCHYIIQSCGIVASRIVRSQANFISWPAPLEGQAFNPIPSKERLVGVQGSHSHQPITAYFVNGPQLFSRSDSVATEKITARLLACLRTTNLASEQTQVLPSLFRLRQSVLVPLLIGLSIADWKFRKLFNDRKLLRITIEASREGLDRVCTLHDMTDFRWTTFWMFFLFWGLIVQLAILLVLPVVQPMDAQAFLKFHFTKYESQTMLHAEEEIDEGAAAGHPANKLIELVQLHPRWNSRMSLVRYKSQ
ncbi:uncharacterized protein BJ171DRAFT_498884 [Polychytrium aggregatum]|uniref:uncharacterized protein n=1 Tax=Polychytrium aggregatum TaxID=110093 RepID=UPI0022FDC8B8|nr:uncharacterized protein BJ171DRAFT_498884 [Polychytrium aggregatum]KAI9206158.1 hypothetical protein BJ171DRAFT_498884 [Polychytrium aggregatum]